MCWYTENASRGGAARLRHLLLASMGGAALLPTPKVLNESRVGEDVYGSLVTSSSRSECSVQISLIPNIGIPAAHARILYRRDLVLGSNLVSFGNNSCVETAALACVSTMVQWNAT